MLVWLSGQSECVLCAHLLLVIFLQTQHCYLSLEDIFKLIFNVCKLCHTYFCWIQYLGHHWTVYSSFASKEGDKISWMCNSTLFQNHSEKHEEKVSWLHVSYTANVVRKTNLIQAGFELPPSGTLNTTRSVGLSSTGNCVLI